MCRSTGRRKRTCRIQGWTETAREGCARARLTGRMDRRMHVGWTQGKRNAPYTCDIANFFDKTKMPISETDMLKPKEGSTREKKGKDGRNTNREETGEVEEELEQSNGQEPEGTRETHEFLLSQEEDAFKVLWEERSNGRPKQTKLRRKSRDCVELKELFQMAAQRDNDAKPNRGIGRVGEDLENILSYISEGAGEEEATWRQRKDDPTGTVPPGTNHAGFNARKASFTDVENPFQTKQRKSTKSADKSKILQLLDRVESVVNQKRKQVSTCQMLHDDKPGHQANTFKVPSGTFHTTSMGQIHPQSNDDCLAATKEGPDAFGAPLDGSAPSMGCETDVELSLRVESQDRVGDPPGATQCTATISRQILDEFNDDFFHFEEEANREYRFQVEEVTDMCGGGPVRRLKLNSLAGGEDCFVYLKDGWHTTPVQIGDMVNIFSDSWTYEQVDGSIHKCCTLSFLEGILVLHPDTILSITRLSTMFDCPRKAVLEERLGGGPSNKWAVLGTLIHELFQSYITTDKDVTDEELSRLIDSIIANSFEKLCEIQSTETEMKMLMTEATPALRKWRQSFMHPQNAQPGDFPGCRVDVGQSLGQRLVVEEVLDIEDNIWSVKLGVKGQIDATLKVKNYGREQAPISPKNELVPLELKTGKPFLTHRAQVVLYALLLSERYNEDVSTGLLFYSRTGETSGIPKLPIEVSSILQARNDLVNWLKFTDGNVHLPPLLESKHQCQRCPQLRNCMLFHNVHEDGTSESSGMPPAFDEMTSHLEGSHRAFFKKWEHLIELERQVSLSRLSEVWSMDGLQRERLGRCLPGMRLKSASPGALLKYDVQDKSLNTRALFFARAEGKDLLVTFQQGDHKGEAQFSDAEIALGDRVIIGVDTEHVVLARGHVVNVDLNTLTIKLMRPLRVPPQKQGDQLLSSDIILNKPVWRIDKDEVVSTMERLKGALVKLVSQQDGHTRRLCRLLVDQQPPRLNLTSPSEQPEQIGNVAHDDARAVVGVAWKDLVKGINADQERVVTACLQKNDYLLVLGMPGTGKTTTIARCVRALVGKGLSVLVATYTNAAVDHLLQKLLEEGVDILRLGRADGVNRKIKDWVIGEKYYPVSSTACIANHLRRANVVGCTSLGAGSPLLGNRGLFDVAIVDEASQITLPACLPPILAAKRFVLVGDHNQLPPLVSSPLAKKNGMDVSLFKQLSDANPQAVIPLKKQYRMCEEIQSLSNSLVYNGKLECASVQVANSRLSYCPDMMQQAVLNMAELVLRGGVVHSQDMEREACWLSSAVDPQMPVAFLDTDRAVPRSHEARKGESLVNGFEMSIVKAVVTTLVHGGVDPGDIMVVSPFRSQVEALSTYLNEDNLDILTVDKCQGRDKPCVLVSFVRSNEDRAPGQLLADLRRLNVALTRAKSKLILIGSRTTLGNLPVFRRAFELLDQRRWFVEVNTILSPFQLSEGVPGWPSQVGAASAGGSLP